jgi:cobalt-precorrin-7 (C5)-methyltransferase
MANLIYIVGIGPGNPDYIPPIAYKVIKNADVLVGGERNLAIFQELIAEDCKETYPIKNNLKEVVTYIKELDHEKKVAVIASGDPGMFGILNYFKHYFSKEELEIIPGISSIQLGAAKAKVSWHDAVLASVHGRPIEDVINLINHHPKVMILTDDNNSPRQLGLALTARGMNNKKVIVGSYLSYPQEEVIETTIEGLSRLAAEYMHCVVIFIDA